jgi:hypothetical protein
MPWYLVLALRPVVTIEGVRFVAAETTTGAVVTTRATKQCPVEAEATVPVPATLKAAAKVSAEIPMTCSGTAECLVTKMRAAMLPGNKACEEKASSSRKAILSFSPFSVLLLEAYSL